MSAQRSNMTCAAAASSRSTKIRSIKSKIADILYAGHAINKKVKVNVESGPQYNAAQNAVRPIKLMN